MIGNKIAKVEVRSVCFETGYMFYLAFLGIAFIKAVVCCLAKQNVDSELCKVNGEFRDGLGLRMGNGISPHFFAF